MKAAVQQRYGSPDVISLQEVETPVLLAGHILVQVRASPVTQGDRRLRSADYPGIAWLPGRLMTGLFRPRRRVPGTMFAGRVVAVGESVTSFAPGDDVFGSCPHGAYAEYLSIAQDAALARMPSGQGYDEAAAMPYGAVTALYFLRELGEVQPGQKVLIVGASGGVGRFAVQLARHFGAEVTGVCSRGGDLVAALGAHHVIDYKSEDFTDSDERYDLILDTSGAVGFSRARGSLTPRGRYMSLYVSVALALQAAVTWAVGGKTASFGVAVGSQDDMREVRGLVERGVIRSVIDSRYPLHLVADAHGQLEANRPVGTVVVTVGESTSNGRASSTAAPERHPALLAS